MAEKKAEETKSPTMELLEKGKAQSKAGAPAVEEQEKTEQAPAAEAETKAKAKAPAKGKVAATGDVIVDTSSLLENLTKEKAFSEAHKLIDEGDFNDFKLGGILAVIQSNSWWEGKGYETFKAFIEGEFNMPYRKAMYLIGIYHNLVESKVPWEKVKDLGWSKLKELASILTLENMDEWIEKAKSMTVLQLIDAIKASQAPEGTANQAAPTEAGEKVTTRSFKLHDGQLEVVNQAVEKAKKDFKTEFDNVAIEHVCLTFIESTTGKQKVKEVTKEVEVVKPITDQMKEMGWEEVLKAFDQVFPEIDITVG